MNEQKSIYKGSKTSVISFPLGGIGTGSIGLAGNGRLIDWEIFNRPNKNSTNGFSFFAIKAESQGKVKAAKILNGDLGPPYAGAGNEKIQGFGFGVKRQDMAGLPHFKETSFKGEFPIAEIDYEETGSPFRVKQIAYNPFIPLNERDSSLPAGIFIFEVTNTSDEELDISLLGSLTNPSTNGAYNRFTDQNSFKSIKLGSTGYPDDDPQFGDLTLSTDSEEISYQSYWFRGGWFDNLTVFWKDFIEPGKFKERNFDEDRLNEGMTLFNDKDVCLLCSHQTLKPGETSTFKYIISWSYPNCINYWSPPDKGENKSWKNYYASQFNDSVSVAAYIWQNFNRLYEETLKFKSQLYVSTLPDVVIEAIASNLAVLKSPTVLRLTDGTLYGFEGCHAQDGCCEGSCSHVWNYEQATAFLFPALARTMRNIEYKYCQDEFGKMTCRLMLPPERTNENDAYYIKNQTMAVADGQMGGIIKTYREWKISGNSAWLRAIWPKVKIALEFAWSPDNAHQWDADKDGVMEGRQHNTLDVELFGPNSWVTGYYLTALKAAAEMASFLGEKDSAAEYLELYENGRSWVDEHLFNGAYYHQQVDLKDKSIVDRFNAPDYWNDEHQELKYQVGEGCQIDQVIGQWYAHIVGLGYVFDQAQVKTALETLYEHNFVKSLRDFPNACRVFTVNDEQGLVISTWPKGNSPKIPVPYQDECMSGFEYSAACQMIIEGLATEGLQIVMAIRDRYDGEKRNPWNEMECGSNYARSMASYALLLAYSGFEYDMIKGHIGFHPKTRREDFNCFWSLGQGWGSFTNTGNSLLLQVQYGGIEIRSFCSDLLADKTVTKAVLGDRELDFIQDGSELMFNELKLISVGDALLMSYE